MPHTPTSTDPVRLYLQDIGRVDLLTQEQELTLARLVQRREQLLREGDPDKDQPGKDELADKERRLTLHRGKRAKERMIQANLRLVVSVAKKYQRRGMDLLDLVQEGTLGLERAVERFDPTRGFASAPTPTGGFARASPGPLPARAARSGCRFTSRRSSTELNGPSVNSAPG